MYIGHKNLVSIKLKNLLLWQQVKILFAGEGFAAPAYLEYLKTL